MVVPHSFPLHGLTTSRYRGESAVCLPSGRRGISPLVSSSVVKFLCHASPVLLRFRVNGSHLFQLWANPNFMKAMRAVSQQHVPWVRTQWWRRTFDVRVRAELLARLSQEQS